MKLAFEISEAQADTLRERAKQLGVQPEELAKAAVADLLTSNDEDFRSAVAHVLEKNTELYKRLAQVRYLSLAEVLHLHDKILAASGGSPGIRDLGRVEAADAQPKAMFDGQELYASLAEKASAICFSLIQGHAFVDGNKRVGHAAMEVFLLLNGHELEAPTDEQERVVLALASSSMSRAEFTTWLQAHARPKGPA